MELPNLSLLKQGETQPEHRPPAGERPPASLVERAGQLCRALPPAGAADGGAVCADGYVRRSPVQPYRVPPEYGRRRRRLALLAALAAVALVLIVVGLWRQGLLRL